MPTARAGFSGDANRSAQLALVLQGPTLLVNIGLDVEHFLSRDSLPALSEELYPVLVDTGSDQNLIDRSFAERLRLPLVGETIVGGIHGRNPAGTYLAQMYIPELDWLVEEEFPAVSLEDSGFEFAAILGRTFLQHFLMTYDGRTGEVIVSND